MLGLLAGAAVGCASETTDRPREDAAPRSVFDATGQVGAGGRSARRDELRPAVTNLGREVLPRVGLVVRGDVRRRQAALAGIEIIRFEVSEVLRQVPWDRLPGDGTGEVLTVFCGEPGMLPAVGAEAVLLLARRAGSPNHDAVQVIELGGAAGDERLAALRSYLAIEEIPDEQERVDALLAYLRRAVRDARRWTRANAALEYGALAAARPDDLGAEDAAVLRTASLASGDAAVQRALRRALDVAERRSRGAPVLLAGGVPPEAGAPPAIDVYVRRYDGAADALERRQAVVDGAVALEGDALPLLRRALGDEDPRVVEAAVASAGQLGLRGLAADLLPLLTIDQPLPLRRSLVRALGYLRVPGAVPTLRALARVAGELGADACYALARIRDADALAGLHSVAEHATGERRELVVYLLSPAFVRQEERMGRPIQGSTDGRDL